MATTQSATQKPVMTATHVYPCCKGGVRQEVGVMIISVICVAIGIAALSNWDFGGIGKLDLTSSVTLIVLGGVAFPIALYILLRKPPVQTKNQVNGKSTAAPVAKLVDAQGNNALHLAAKAQFDTSLSVAEQLRKLEELAIEDVDYAAVNHDGQTPLHCAVIARNDVTVVWLLEKIKDKKNVLNIQDRLGNTALHYAYMAFHENGKGEYISSSRHGPIGSREVIMNKLMGEPDLNTTTLRNKDGALPIQLKYSSP